MSRRWLDIRSLVGRSSEMDTLRTLLHDVAEGAGAVAVIEGVAGIGKTRLLEEALAHAERAGFHILRGAGDELERDRPFRAIAEALRVDPHSDDPARAEIGRRLRGEPVAGGGSLHGAGDLSYPIIDAVVDLLEELCTTGQVVVALEDLHWADPSTIRAVRSVARRLAHWPAAVLVTFRPVPSSADLDRAVEDLLTRGAHHIVLSGLDDEAAADLAEDLLSAKLGPALRREVDGTGGSPLFAVELIKALRAEGAIAFQGGVAELAEASIPASLRLVILRRLSFLPAETLDLLTVASILGRSFSLTDLSTITGRKVVELLALLTVAFRAELLGEGDDRIAFRHDLIRKVVYEELPHAVRRDLHREAGWTLAAAGAPPAQVAEQLSLGAVPGDAEAVRWLRHAARDAAPHSAAVSVRLLERALALTTAADPQRGAVLSELSVPLLTLGRLAEADAVSRAALALAEDPADRTLLRENLATVVFFRGDRPGARALFASNADTLGISQQQRSANLALASLTAMYAGDLDDAETLAVAGHAAGEQSGGIFGASMSLTTLCGVASMRGYAGTALELGSRAVELAARAERTWASRYIHPNLRLGAACLDGDQLEQAENALRAGRERSERTGMWDLPYYQMYLGAKHFMSGAWDDAVAELEAGLSLVAEMEFTPFAAVLLPQGVLAAIAVHRDDLARAAAALAVALEEFARSGPQLGVDAMLWARAQLLEAYGDSGGARQALETAWMVYSSLGYQTAYRWVAADLVRLAVGAGDVERARSVVEDVGRWASRAGTPTADGAALRCRGLLDADADTLVASVDAYRKGLRPFERARASEDAAVALGRDGRREEGHVLLDEAIDVYEAVGALRDLGRAEAALRYLGVRRGQRGHRRRPRLGWESLTPTQTKVVELVGQGMRNRAIAERLFISPRTVETHVAHLFTKLGVASRTELAAAAARRLG